MFSNLKKILIGGCFGLTEIVKNMSTISNDAPQPWQLGFQDSAAPGFTGLVTLHNTIGFYLIVISISVFWVLFSTIYSYSEKKNPIAHKYLTHGTVLELIWTITPALILICIAFPSFRLLYLMDCPIFDINFFKFTSSSSAY
jgi:cytochrome c oxidase subunit 2